MNIFKKFIHEYYYIPKQRVMIIGGCFDILHNGHLDFLKKAKKHCDYLIVLLEPDQKIKAMKGLDRPINNYKLRIKNLEKTGIADKVILLPILTTSEGYQKFIENIRKNPLEISSNRYTFYFGITKNDKNIQKNKNITKLGERMKIEVIEVNKLLPSHSTTNLLKS